jgi:protein TonB
MSVALHVAIVGLVAAGTVTAPRHDPPDTVTVVPLPQLLVERRVTTDPGPSGSTTTALPSLAAPRRIDLSILPTAVSAPDLAQVTLPERGTTPPEFGPYRGFTQSVGGVIGQIDPADGGAVLTGSEALMRVITLARPRYPEVLRNAGLSGRVLLQFIVDTTGRIDIGSAKTLQTTHDLFTRAVLAVLPDMRFLPTEVNGKRVRALAQMPFEFVVVRK